MPEVPEMPQVPPPPAPVPEEVAVSVDDGIATLSLRRPAKRNAVTYEMWLAIAGHCRAPNILSIGPCFLPWCRPLPGSVHPPTARNGNKIT